VTVNTIEDEEDRELWWNKIRRFINTVSHCNIQKIFWDEDGISFYGGSEEEMEEEKKKQEEVNNEETQHIESEEETMTE
jgi:hypothetical protein